MKYGIEFTNAKACEHIAKVLRSRGIEVKTLLQTRGRRTILLRTEEEREFARSIIAIGAGAVSGVAK